MRRLDVMLLLVCIASISWWCAPSRLESNEALAPGKDLPLRLSLALVPGSPDEILVSLRNMRWNEVRVGARLCQTVGWESLLVWRARIDGRWVTLPRSYADLEHVHPHGDLVVGPVQTLERRLPLQLEGEKVEALQLVLVPTRPTRDGESPIVVNERIASEVLVLNSR